jgi:hypothetical protein
MHHIEFKVHPAYEWIKYIMIASEPSAIACTNVFFINVNNPPYFQQSNSLLQTELWENKQNLEQNIEREKQLNY